MNEYVIHAKVKNNLILRRILNKYENVAQFCKAHGLCNSQVGAFINMKERALTKDGDWSIPAKKLADALDVDCEELFTEEQAECELKSNSAYIEMSRQQALAMSDPLAAVENMDLLSKLFEAAHLNDNQLLCLQMRQNDATLGDVGKALNVTRERVRKIEIRALSKLRRAARKIGEMSDEQCSDNLDIETQP